MHNQKAVQSQQIGDGNKQANVGQNESGAAESRSPTQQSRNEFDAKNNAIDVYQTLVDLQHGIDLLKKRSPSSDTGQHSTPQPSGTRQPSFKVPLQSKLNALDMLNQTIVVDKRVSIAVFADCMPQLFQGFESCLRTQQLQLLYSQFESSPEFKNNTNTEIVIDIVLKANQFLFEIMPDIQSSLGVENHMTKLIPIFIENLGSPKAVVRKSTHKCIGTYVKLTKKLEYVLKHIVQTGLENQNSRTRQHSMLVIPALLSLKAAIMESEKQEMKDLLRAVIARIQNDSSEIVAKTGKKLVLELQKCYPAQFKQNYVDSLGEGKDMQICAAIITNDETELKRILSCQPPPNQRSTISPSLATASQQSSVMSQAKASNVSQLHQKNELSSIGREIMMNVPQHMSQAPSQQQPSPAFGSNNRAGPLAAEIPPQKAEALQMELPSTALAESAKIQPILVFGFLEQEMVDALEESRSWQDRTQAIEQVEAQLNRELSSSDRKVLFLQHATAFLGFIIGYITDMNFKVSLTAINMTSKILVLNVAKVNKHYANLVRALIEKLSDSKVVIRQAVLKCCSVLIRQNSPSQFANHAIGYLGHTNWHVREGILHLIANCLIVQGQQDELNGNLEASRFGKAAPDSSGRPEANTSGDDAQPDRLHSGAKDLAVSPVLLGQLCQMAKNEIKAKIQQMAVDNLALCIDISKDVALTQSLIQRDLGMQQNSGSMGAHDEPQASRMARELYNQIQQRSSHECLPAMQIDGSIEFKASDYHAPQASDLGRSKGDLKLSAVEYQLSPNRLGGTEQNAGMPNRARGNVQADAEDPRANKQQARSIDHMSAVKRSLPTAPESQNNEKISTWLPSFNNGQDKNQSKDQSEGSEFSYEPQGAFQGTKRRLNGATNGTNINQDDVKISGSNSHSLNNLRRQTSVHKQPLNVGGSLHAEPQSAGVRLSNNNLRNSSQKAESSAEPQRNFQSTNEPSQPFNNELRFEKLMQGYTPIQHNQKPRVIQSNEMRQRTLDNGSIAQSSPSPKLVPRAAMTKNEFASMQQSPMLTNETKSQMGEPSALRAGAITGYNAQPATSTTDMKVMQVRNMSQSSGAPGGFGVNKAAINERLQLLKSTFKYKNQSEHETQSNLGDPRTFDNTDRRLKYDAGATAKKANSEYNAREDTKLPAVTTLNNNNYMMQTGGAVSGVSGSQVSAAISGVGGSGGGGHAMEKPQQTSNSFGISNVSTNVNNNFNGGKSYSANKQLQSTKTTGYNFGGSGTESKVGGARRELKVYQYNAYDTTLLDNQNLNRSGLERSSKAVNIGVQGSHKGPIKATPMPPPQQEYMNTIQIEQNHRNTGHYALPSDQMQQPQNQRQMTNNHSVRSEQAPSHQNRKPPVSKASLHSAHQQQQLALQQRASSVNANTQLSESSMMRDNFQTPKKSWNAAEDRPIKPAQDQTSALGPAGTQTATHYNAPEEPLKNPEQSFKQSLQDLKSQDWQKIFDGLNTVKRVAQFHKELFVMTSGPLPKEAIKLIVKQTENLRSQISKNACMTLQVIYSELPTKDLDSNVDVVMQALLKKSTDTNHFVSEQAEKALMMVCHASNETKVLNCIQSDEGKGKGPSFRHKVALSYCFLIEKLGPRVRTYKDSQRIVKAVVSMLGEGAAEVRNQAKIAIAQIKSNIQNGREFDGLLMRSGLSEQQVEQAKKASEQSEYNATSNVNNTRYGGSMRGSSMDSRAHGSEAQRRTPHAFPGNLAMGSDGFSSQNFTDQKMQQTFLSGGAHAAAMDTSPGSIYSNNMQSNAFGMTNTSHHPSFKKRQTSMSKPIDPAIMDEFKAIIQQSNTHDWNKRVQSVDQLDAWITKHTSIVKQSPASKFIQLVDIKCKMIQDNNAKVQNKAMSSFKDFLLNDAMQHLKEQNLTMILQAIAATMTSSQPSIRMQTDQLMSILEDTIDNKAQLIQPIIAQVNLQNTKSKVQLLQRLSVLITRVEQLNIVERYVQPLFRPSNKIQNEATLNPKLREALRQLELAYQQVIKR